MPRPSTADVRVRPDIAESMLEFPLEGANFNPIATELFPVVEVDEAEGSQGLLTAEEILTPSGGPRQSTGGYLRNKLKFTDFKWKTDENGGEGVIDERDKNKFKNYFDHEVLVAKVERFRAFQRRERRCANLVNNTGNYAGRTRPLGSGLNDYATSRPVTVIEQSVQAIKERSGLPANTLQMSWKSFRNLRHNEEVIDRITSLGAGSPAKQSDITIQLLKQVFDLEHIFVGDMPINTANINQAKRIKSIWSDELMLVCYNDYSGDVSMPGHLRTCHWGEDGSTMDGLVEDYYNTDIRSHIIRVRQDTEEKHLINEMGELITGVLE